MSTKGRVLVILAHPDDPEFFCGGTVGRWVREGWEIIYILATHGERGSDDPTVPTEQLARIREEEQRAAARVLGVREVVFLDYPDGSPTPSLGLRRDLTRQIRRWRPSASTAPRSLTRTAWRPGCGNGTAKRSPTGRSGTWSASGGLC